MQQVIALYDYSDPSEPSALPFNAGDVIHVISQLESGWFDGICNGQRGWFPSNYVQEKKQIKLPTPITTTLTQHPKQHFTSAQSGHSNQSINSSDKQSTAASSSPTLRTVLNNLALDSNITRVNPTNTPNSMNAKPQLANLNVHHLQRQPKSNSQLHYLWSKKESADGRPYYYNMKSDLTTWNLADIDYQTGDLLVPKSPAIVISINEPATPASPAERAFEAQAIANGWSSCSTLIQNSIITICDAAKMQNGAKVITYASTIVDNIRHMFYASDTAKVDSPYLESNTILKSYHKQITNSLSKLVMCAKAASAHNAPFETLTLLSQSATELLMAIKYFIPIAVSSGVPFNSENTPMDTLTSQINLANSSTDPVQQLSLSIERSFIQSQQLLHALDTELFSTNIINRVRYLVTEIGSFLTLVDDVELDVEDTGSELHSDFKSNQLNLYNQVSSLVMETQHATQSQSPMTNMHEIAKICKTVNASMQRVFELIGELIHSQDEVSDMIANIKFEKDKRSISMVQVSKQFSPIEAQPNSAPVGRRESTDYSESDNETQRKLLKDRVLKKKFGEVPMVRGDPASPKIPPKDTPRGNQWGKEYDQSDLVFGIDGSLKSATLEVLVQKLCFSDSNEADYQRSFLMMYRSFTTSLVLFDMLVKRYELQAPSEMTSTEQTLWNDQKQNPVKQNICGVFKMWVELYMQNEIGDFQVMSAIRTFSEQHITRDFSFLSGQLSSLVDKRIGSPDQFNRRTINTRSAPPCLLSKSVNFRKVKLVDIDCLEVARQLTLIDFEGFIKIQSTEFIQKAWTTKVNTSNTNIKNMIQFSNQITQWVSMTILNERDLKKRGVLLKFFIGVAEKLKILNNFNSLMAVLSALNCSAVHRLNRTWSTLPTKSIVVLDGLRRIMDPSKNFGNYKEQLRMVSSACVPFLGFYLTDLTFLEEGNSDNVTNLHGKDLINFNKRAKTADLIVEIQNYQSVPYAITLHDEMTQWLGGLMQVDECDLFTLSLILEPKEREDEKIARLLIESGFL